MEYEVRELLGPSIADGHVSIIEDGRPVFAAIAESFPVSLNRIAFWDAPGVIEGNGKDTDDPGSAFVSFLRAIAKRESLRGEVVAVVDHAFDFALRGDFAAILNILPVVTDFPQHVYVCPYPEATWCASHTFEDDFYFAYAPSKPGEAG